MLLPCFLPNVVEAGCDEAGRGCLAGPVFAAAVILPDHYENADINDSKQLSERRRQALCDVIMRDAVAWSVAQCSPEEIDQMNILNASITAMHRALDGLNRTLDHIIVDGNRFRPYRDVPYHTVVKGDGKYLSIAAASILAKCFRDRHMEALDAEFPAYQWKKNKGYPTEAHRNAIRAVGASPHHRMTFTLLPIEAPTLPFPD